MCILFFAADFGPYYDDDDNIPLHLLTDNPGMIGTYIAIQGETIFCAEPVITHTCVGPRKPAHSKTTLESKRKNNTPKGKIEVQLQVHMNQCK